MKSSKTIKKRFRITKNKKVIHRFCGQDHFRSRKAGKIILKKRQPQKLSKSFEKTVKTYIK
ncbi:MAG: Uncharacterized protein Athens101410_447 [Parcubacteria group bacterium Athens1014_10]|nr:MAG: Uncharacterized protein Athens101410_447 [Parcubacteria group bacterium Athens1014_10]